MQKCIQAKTSFHNNKFLFIGSIILLIVSGCGPTTPISPPASHPTASLSPEISSTITPNPTDEPPKDISFGIEIDEPSSPGMDSNVLDIDAHIDCFCINNQIKALLSLKSQNGTPPYIIPGFEFVETQSFSGNLGDIYSITIKSSDDPPLTWKSDITLECNPVPNCSSSSTISVPPISTKSGGASSGGSSSGGTSSGGTSSGGSSSGGTSSGGTSSGDTSSECQTKDCDKMIDECPPPGQGGEEPPGICKKK